MTGFLQINVGGREAQDFMEVTAARLKVDIIIVSEQVGTKSENEGWYCDQGNKAAVVVFNNRLQITEIGPRDNQGFRWMAFEGIRVYACYWSPNTDFKAFEDFLDRLEVSIRNAGTPVLIAGDFNAKSPEWGDHQEDRKGHALADWLASLKTYQFAIREINQRSHEYMKEECHDPTSM